MKEKVKIIGVFLLLNLTIIVGLKINRKTNVDNNVNDNQSNTTISEPEVTDDNKPNDENVEDSTTIIENENNTTNDNKQENTSSNTNETSISKENSNKSNNKNDKTKKDNNNTSNNKPNNSKSNNQEESTTKENNNQSNGTSDVTEKTCTPKKFIMPSFRADFDSFDKCQSVGNSLIKSSELYYGYFCDNMTDDCGTTYYMLSIFDEHGNYYEYNTIKP